MGPLHGRPAPCKRPPPARPPPACALPLGQPAPANRQAHARAPRAPPQVRIVQKLTLKPLEERIACMEGAGYNTFLLQNADEFLGAPGHARRCSLGLFIF